MSQVNIFHNFNKPGLCITFPLFPDRIGLLQADDRHRLPDLTPFNHLQHPLERKGVDGQTLVFIEVGRREDEIGGQEEMDAFAAGAGSHP